MASSLLVALLLAVTAPAGTKAPVEKAPAVKAPMVKAPALKAPTAKAPAPIVKAPRVQFPLTKAPAAKAPRKAQVKGPPGKPAKGAIPAAPKIAASQVLDEAPEPAAADPDRERILRLQQALESIAHGPVLGRLRVGMRVEEASTGRLFFRRRGATLMDPASNQKVLATATALLRLGGDYRFRTELVGPSMNDAGVVEGDVVLRGSGDPSLRVVDLEQLAAEVASRGVLRIQGSVRADGRRIGAPIDAGPDERSPLRVSRGVVVIRVRPGEKAGAPAALAVRPVPDAFVVTNRVQTRASGRSRVTVSLSVAGGRMHALVTGRIARTHPGLVLRRTPPHQRLFAAALLTGALREAGVEVTGAPAIVPVPPRHVPVAGGGSETLFATTTGESITAHVAASPSVQDPVPPNVEASDLGAPPRVALAVHESEPLTTMIRHINKASDNEYAERLLSVVGAELQGGEAANYKGIAALRAAMAELGLRPEVYRPSNGSGLGHTNRISADGMADLLRRLYLDPRIGPEMLQSLSVGGVDGTTRNRFRGSPAAERVRAKTGTLSGKSALSGFVGDGGDVLVFSILVEGLRGRKLGTTAVRQAQVAAVNAMMRYARGAEGELPGDDLVPSVDLEAGDENLDAEAEEDDPTHPDGEAPAPVGPSAPGRSEVDESHPP